MLWVQLGKSTTRSVLRDAVSALSIAVVLLISECTFAGALLEYIRNYDLNDYAVGVGISAAQNPYLGAENSNYAYPYLTSFRHSSFTDDWILIRDGELGLRWVSENGWEVGAIGRIQTLGLGVLETGALLGIADRHWALEMGPTIGCRGWPVHINWTTYFEPTDRHNGISSDIALLLPKEWSRGYFVPSIEAIYRTDDYNDYYYSVTPSESTSTRLVYVPGASISMAFNMRWGYALSEKWLMTGKIGVEVLPSEISASPIIEHDRTWSGGIALAYNANVFRPREYDDPDPRAKKLELWFGAFRDTIDTKIAKDTADGVPGVETDIEDVLGAADNDTVLQVEATVRIGHYHRLEFGYFELVRDSTTILNDELSFGDELFSAGTEVSTHVDASVFRAGYAYSLIRNAQLEFSVMAGVHIFDLDAEIFTDSGSQRVRSKAGTPLPVIGAQASVFLGDATTLGAKLHFFRTNFDRYEGSLNFVSVEVQRRIGNDFSVGLAYNFYGMNLTSSNKNVNGYIKVRHHGPVAFFAVGF